MKINPDTVKSWLGRHSHSREWLAKKCGVAAKTLNNWIGSDRGFPAKAVVIIQQLMAADQQAEQAAEQVPQNLVLEFTDDQFTNIENKALSKGQTAREWAKLTLNNAAAIDEMISNITKLPRKKAIPTFTSLEKYGAIAAGQPVTTQLEGESVVVPGEWSPEIHKVVEINGQSGEPVFIDGDEWIIDITKKGMTATKGKPAVFTDSQGCYLKIYNGKGKPFTSVNPAHPDAQPDETLTLIGYPVERISS